MKQIISQFLQRMQESTDATEDAEMALETTDIEEWYPTQLNEDMEPYREIHPHQKAFHRGIAPSGKEANIIALGGGYGSGKSVAATVQLVNLCQRYPNLEVFCIAPYNYYFYDLIWPTFEKVIPFDHPFVSDFSVGNQVLEFANGSRITFRSYDDPQKVRGWEANVIWIEEASELGDNNPQKATAIFQALLGRLRKKDRVYKEYGGLPVHTNKMPRKMYLTFNPSGHNWIWKQFIQGNPYGDEGKRVDAIESCKHFSIEAFKNREIWEKCLECSKTCQKPCSKRPQGCMYREYEKPFGSSIAYTITSSTLSNPTLPYDYIANMVSNYDIRTMRRYVEGTFLPMNVLVYEWPYYSPETHHVTLESVLDYYGLPEEEKAWCLHNNTVPREWHVIVGIDVGGPRSPWAVEYYAVTPDERLICFDEIYTNSLTWDEIAEEIKKKEERHSWIDYYIDPYSSPQKQGPKQESVKEFFGDRNIQVSNPTSGNIFDGIHAVRNLLRRNTNYPCPYLPDSYDDTSGKYEIGSARLYYIASQCPKNIMEKAVWRYDVRREHLPTQEEEGLSPKIQEKPVDRDDHAQRAEHFAILGARLTPEQIRRERLRNRKTEDYEAQEEPRRGLPVLEELRKKNGWRKY